MRGKFFHRVVNVLIQIAVVSLFGHQNGQGQPFQLAVVVAPRLHHLIQPFRQEFVRPQTPGRPVHALGAVAPVVDGPAATAVAMVGVGLGFGGMRMRMRIRMRIRMRVRVGVATSIAHAGIVGVSAAIQRVIVVAPASGASGRRRLAPFARLVGIRGFQTLGVGGGGR